ncbi:hypothetical protein [Fulvivirga sedimenti]|uniref:Uncharacterized protein n=1 Tax=Fulvivirga sedimenti TaxID=2879465 RepID=A0A9X1HQY6_9BACT|nr:hypothetical protein [Fulvivirga sedimenti]MCA6075610.1 hypothetical protein [Fulvivirga sedimenti]
MIRILGFVVLILISACTSVRPPQFWIEGFQRNGQIENRKDLNAPFKLSVKFKDWITMVATLEEIQSKTPVSRTEVTLVSKGNNLQVITNPNGQFTFPINDAPESISFQVEGYDRVVMTFPKHYWDPYLPEEVKRTTTRKIE